MRYRAAALAIDSKMFDKNGNIARIIAMADEAAANGAKLIAAPEMALTGYCYASRAELAPYVETVPGPSTDAVAAIAKKHGCCIAFGMGEHEPSTDLYYNSVVLVGPDGLIGVYRKSHSFIADPKFAADGDRGIPVFDTPFGRIAMLNCMDMQFIETARLAAVRGADVILHANAWFGEPTPSPLWMTRAYDSGIYIVASNRTGHERGIDFPGGSCIIAPDGSIEASIDRSEGIVYAEIDTDRTRRSELMRRRLPSEYTDIALNTYVWNGPQFHKLYGIAPLPKGKASRVSVAQFAPTPRDADANIAEIARLADEAARDGGELLVLPEYAATGATAESALSADDIAPRLAEISRAHGLYMVAGFAERDGDRLFSSAALTAPDGSVMGVARRLHVAEREWASRGDNGLSLFDTPVGRLGLLIGSDADFPECGRVLAVRGADILCCPAAASSPAPIALLGNELHWHLWRVRAGENNCTAAFANMTGTLPSGERCFGTSGVFGPDSFLFPRREIVMDAGTSGTATADVSTEPGPRFANPMRTKDLVRMRRTALYADLVRL